MKKPIYIAFYIFLFALSQLSKAQLSTTAPYCCGAYTSGQCNQPGVSNSPTNFINDFINDFSTTGANTNISNLNSGCNGAQNNCANHCSHYMAVSPGQTIVCTLVSGITFAQGFAMWVDWDQDLAFNMTNEFVGGTAGVPTAATPTTITFVIPLTQPNGTYRLRVRCAFATPGTGITPCGNFGFGETEDYTLFVGPVPPTSAVPSGTALVNTPVCVGQPLSFTFSTTYLTPLTYSWTGPNNYTNTTQNPTIFNSTAPASGVYTVFVTNGICPITRTVSALVVPYPTYTPSANPATICQGSTFFASILSALNPINNYSAQWTSTAPGLIFNPNPTLGNPPTFGTTIQPALLPPNVTTQFNTYSVTISPTIHPACAVTQTIGVTINNPSVPSLTMTVPVCNNHSVQVQFSATPGGGTWSANPAVAPNGILTPSLATIGTNTVMYTTTIGNCAASNTGSFHVSQYITPALTTPSIALRCVQDPPFDLMNIVQNTTTGFWKQITNPPGSPTPTYVVNNFFHATGLPTNTYVVMHKTFSTPLPNVCMDSVYLTISVHNPPVPVITAITPTCNNSPTMIVTATPTNGGIWSGNPGISASGIRTPSLHLIGTNTVMYTAGIGTCVASSSTTFHISQYNTAAFSGIIPDLCNTSPNVNLMSIVQNTNGIWTGQYTNSITSIFSPSQSILASPTAQLFTLKYYNPSSPNPSLCRDSNEVVVSLLHPTTPTVSSTNPVCSKGAAVQLAVNPNLGHWVASTYLTTSGIFTPSLAAIGNNAVQYVIGTNTCYATSQPVAVSVEAFVPATLTGSLPDQCNTNLPVSLAPLAVNPSGNWTGPGVSTGYFTPSALGAGNFIINYNTASSPSGLCPDQSTLAVQVFSLAAPIIKPLGPFCNSSLPVQLQVSPVGGIFSGPMPGAVSSEGIFHPAFAVEGDNLISYTISSGPCLAYAQSKISIEKFVSAGLAKDVKTVYCKNEQPFNLNSLVENPGGAWTGGGAALIGSMFDPSKANIGDNNILEYHTSSASALLCPDSRKVKINIKDVPVVTALSNITEGCAPFEVVFNTPSANSGKGIWNITDGARLEGLVTSHVFTTPGKYDVVFSYQDNNAGGCVAQFVLPTPITVLESPKADFSISPEEISISSPEITLTNMSSVFSNNKYTWTIPGVKDLNPNELHPKVKFPHPGNYKISLLATSFEGCKNEISKTVDVRNEFNVHIPNSFTPNYDGLNDTFIPVFSPYGLDTRTFEMEIFDRWGHQVYSTKDYTKGWNGHIKDEVAKEGTYVYKLRYKDLEGRVYNKTGYLSLLIN